MTGNKLLGTTASGDPEGTFSNAYTYNAHGSMITMPHLLGIDWNYAEQLQSTDLGGGGLVRLCDGRGKRRHFAIY